MFSFKRKYLISCIGFIAFLSWIINSPNHPMTNLNVDEIIKSFGYPSEVHEVITEDGYLNTINRIPFSEKNHTNSSVRRIPVLLIPGMLQSAADYVLAGPEKALGLLLADRGFDVWMANTRGSRFSRKHTRFNPETQREYWNSTAHEVAVFDTSSNIDYILNITNQSNLHYIGFSQGTSQLFMTISERPEYNKKIRLFSALSPVFFVQDLNHFFMKIISNQIEIVRAFLEFTKTDEILTSNGLLANFQKFICNGNSLLIYFCAQHIKTLQEGDTHVDRDSLPSLTSHLPAGIGTKHFVHCMQIIRDGALQKFDYGSKVNLELYGQETPYKYNISKLTAPTALYYSKGDSIINWKNMAKIESGCSSIIRSYEIPLKNFCHLDFLLAKDAVTILYNTLIDEMMKY